MDTLVAIPTVQYSQQDLIGIYDQHNPGLYPYRLLGDPDLAEECVAETFSRFLKSVQTRQTQVENVQAYLYRSAHNWITDQYRRQAPSQVLEDDLPAEAHSDPAHMVANNLEQERVRHALRLLPSEQRQVIALRFLEELPHEEVAVALGKTVEATRALQYRALTALRRILLDREQA
jgi:RNA polymerase sigma-70 factor (ECF subfamily)